MNFRKTKAPYGLCKHIFGNYDLFHIDIFIINGSLATCQLLHHLILTNIGF